jgi:4-hydroxy-2-oxoheptanedioate aldolase
MHPSKVKKTWKEGGIALGTLVKSIDPVHTEARSQMAFDFLWYDLEHSDKSVETFSNLSRATRVGNVDVLARPARWEFMRMSRLLEAGAHGIMYPRCESAKEARDVVRWAKFHPLGERGFDGGSADNNYGQYPASNYTQEANENTWIAAQVESPSAVEKVGEIASIEGIDCVFFGPGDYSALSGRPGDVQGKETLEAAKTIAEETLAAGKIFGTLVFDMDHAQYMKDLGAQLLVHGADIVFYKQAYTELLDAYSTFRSRQA